MKQGRIRGGKEGSGSGGSRQGGEVVVEGSNAVVDQRNTTAATSSPHFFLFLFGSGSWAWVGLVLRKK